MRTWHERMIILVLWLIAGWVAWDFLWCMDPPQPRDLTAHPLRICAPPLSSHP